MFAGTGSQKKESAQENTENIITSFLHAYKCCNYIRLIKIFCTVAIAYSSYCLRSIKRAIFSDSPFIKFTMNRKDYLTRGFDDVSESGIGKKSIWPGLGSAIIEGK